MIDAPEHNPEQIRLESLIGLAEKRVARAAVKQRSATREMADALDALDSAHARLAEWTAANPDPQGNLLRLVAA